MDIAELYKLQKEYEENIEKELPTKNSEDRISKKILAFNVEIGKLADIWRGYKYWSFKQTPEVEKEKCDYCGEMVEYTRPSPFMEVTNMCKGCWDVTREEYKGSDGVDIGPFEDFPFEKKEPTKLLDQYVSCFRFILAVGLESYSNYGVELPINFEVGKKLKSVKYKNIAKQFNRLFDNVGYLEDCLFEGELGTKGEVQEQYKFILQVFLGLGEMLELDLKKVKTEYVQKTKKLIG